MAISHVQDAYAGSGLAASVGITLGSSVTSGNLLAAAIGLPPNESVTSITDSQSNRWIQCSYAKSNGGNCELWYARGVQGGHTTVTVSLSTAASVGVNISEWSGVWYVDPLDQWSQTAGTTASVMAQAVTPRLATGELAIAVTSSSASVSGPNGGYTGLAQPSATVDYGYASSYKILSGSVSTAASWTGGPSKLSPYYNSQIAALNPLGWWKFADPTGTTVATDSSGNGHGASVQGTVSFGVPSPYGDQTAASLAAGAGSYFNAGSVQINQSSWSLTAWVKLASGGARYIVDNQGSSSLGYYVWVSTGELTAGINGVSTQSAASVFSDNNWHMLAFVTSPSGFSWYLDGTPFVTSGSNLGTPSISYQPLLIGQQLGTNEPSAVYNVALFGGALTSQQISQLYTDQSWAVAEALFVPGQSGLNPNLQFPEVLVEMSTTNNYLAPLEGLGIWTNITSYVEGMTLGPLGRQHELDRVQATTAQITVNNRTGVFNPWNTTSFLYNGGLGLLPMNPVRVTAAWNGINYPEFYGYAQGITPTISDVLNVDSQINCVDILQILSLKYLASNNYEQLVLQDGGTNLLAYYRLGDPIYSFKVADSSGNGNDGSLISGAAGLPSFGVTGPFLYDPSTALDLTNGSNSPNGGISMTDTTTQPPTPTPLPVPSSNWTFECWASWTSQDIPSASGGIGNGILFNYTATAGTSTIYDQLTIGWGFGEAVSTAYTSNTPNTFLVTEIIEPSQIIDTSDVATGIPFVFDGKFHHYVITSSRTTNLTSIWVDGQLIPEATGSPFSYSGPFSASITAITIGTTPPGITPPEIGNSNIIPIPWGGAISDVAIYTDILTASQIQNHYAVGSWFKSQEFGAAVGDTTAGRLNKVMTVCGLDPSTTLAVPYEFKTLLYAETDAVTTTSGLNYLQTQTETEPGLIFQGPDGLIYAYNRQYQYLNPTSTTSQGIISDSSNSGYYYDGPSLQIAGDDLDIWNDIQVQSGRSAVSAVLAADGSTITPAQVAGALQEWGPPQSNAAAQSASVYGSRTLQGLTSLQQQYDSDALALSQWYGTIYNDPIRRVTQVTLNSQGNNGANIPLMLGSGLYDRLTIEYTGQTPGPTFQQDSLVEQITHTIVISGGPTWTTQLAMSPYEILLYPVYLGVWKFGDPASEGVLTL